MLRFLYRQLHGEEPWDIRAMQLLAAAPTAFPVQPLLGARSQLLALVLERSVAAVHFGV